MKQEKKTHSLGITEIFFKFLDMPIEKKNEKITDEDTKAYLFELLPSINRGDSIRYDSKWYEVIEKQFMLGCCYVNIILGSIES